MSETAWQPSMRVPDSAVVVLDESFRKYYLPLCKVDRLAAGLTRWGEGYLLRDDKDTPGER